MWEIYGKLNCFGNWDGEIGCMCMLNANTLIHGSWAPIGACNNLIIADQIPSSTKLGSLGGEEFIY